MHKSIFDLSTWQQFPPSFSLLCGVTITTCSAPTRHNLLQLRFTGNIWLFFVPIRAVLKYQFVQLYTTQYVNRKNTIHVISSKAKETCSTVLSEDTFLREKLNIDRNLIM